MENITCVENEDKKTRLLDNIISSYQNFENRYCETLEAWRNLKYYDKKKFAKYLAEQISSIDSELSKFRKNGKFIAPNKPNENNIKDIFKITWNDELAFGQPENMLETLIAYSLDTEKNKFTKVINQLYVPDGGHMDLYCEKNNQECYLIELKQWQNITNSPLYSIIEVIKNFYLLQEKIFKDSEYSKIINFNDIKNFNLIVLAPNEYYEYYKTNTENSVYELLSEFLKELKLKTNRKRNAKINIRLMSFDFPKVYYDDFCKQIQLSIETDKNISFHKGMSEISELCLKDYYSFLNPKIKESLKSENWKTILKNKIEVDTSSSDA